MDIRNIDFLRNDHGVDIVVAGITYPSVEHAYQACKTDDQDMRTRIAAEPSSQKARKLGRQVVPIENWKEKRLDIMEMLVRQKFFSDDDLQDNLIDTGRAPLLMVRDDDTFWGCSDNGGGANHLGKILEKVRAEAQFIRGWNGSAELSSALKFTEVVDGVQDILDEVSSLFALLKNVNLKIERKPYPMRGEPEDLSTFIGNDSKKRLSRRLFDLKRAYARLRALIQKHEKDEQDGSGSAAV